jgi:hypothetical protein
VDWDPVVVGNYRSWNVGTAFELHDIGGGVHHVRVIEDCFIRAALYGETDPATIIEPDAVFYADLDLYRASYHATEYGRIASDVIPLAVSGSSVAYAGTYVNASFGHVTTSEANLISNIWMSVEVVSPGSGPT